jgi:transcriptional regulator with XRE-family HTH domain/tetratricopeptide (TPR) repeat protein
MFHSYHCFSPIPATILLLATCKDEMLDAEDGYMEISLLKQERLNRHWSRARFEKLTGIPQRSLENWEEGRAFPREENIRLLCKLYGKSRKQLGLDKARESHDIMGAVDTIPMSEEETPMSDIIRRALFGNLGSRIFSLIDTWPKRDYHYEELQTEIHKAIFDTQFMVGTDMEMGRREALKSVALLPIGLFAGPSLTLTKQKTDTDTLLKRCAAAIAVCWYMRRGKELAFTNDAVSEYIKKLRPLIYSLSESYRKAACTLLAQCFILKSKLAHALEDNDQAIAYEEEAIQYAELAQAYTETTIANREMALLYWHRGKQGYKQALPYAEVAYGLAKNTPRIIRSFTASGLSLCQAACGQTEYAQKALAEAHDLFDPTILILSMPYSESMLLATAASVHRHSQSFQEAIDLYEKILTIPDISTLGAVGERIKYAETEVIRDDVQARDMELCVDLLTKAITGAKELDSKLYIRKAGECFTLMRVAWPREQAIKTLGKDHFGVK